MSTEINLSNLSTYTTQVNNSPLTNLSTASLNSSTSSFLSNTSLSNNDTFNFSNNSLFVPTQVFNNFSQFNTLIFPLSTELLYVKEVITGERSNNKSKNNFSLIQTIENNKNIFLTLEKVKKIKEYKKAINDSKFMILENKVDMLLSIKNNSDIFIDTFFEKIEKTDSFVQDLYLSIDEKNNKIKLNHFENKLNYFILNPNTSTEYFNTITNYFYNNINNVFIDNDLVENVNIRLLNNKKSTIAGNFLNEDFYTKHNLIKVSQNNNNSFSKEIRQTINDNIVQNIISMIRNFYTISASCLIGNYIDDNFLYIDNNNSNLKSVSQEKENLNIFNFIKKKNDVFNSFAFIHSSNSLIKEKLFFNTTINGYYSSSIKEANGGQYLPSAISNYIDNNMIYRFSQNNHLKNRQTGNNGSSWDHPTLTIIKEINKIYTGKFFNVDLSKLEQNRLNQALGVASSGLNNFLASTGPGRVLLDADAFVIADTLLFFNNYSNNSNNEIIYYYDNPITKYVEKDNSFKGDIDKNNYFNIDSIVDINDLKYKLEIDSFVKKNKLKHLKNINVDFNFSNQIIDNINKSQNNNYFVSYTKENTESVSVIDENSEIYDMLFTDDEENNVTYSHIDLVTNHTVDNNLYSSLEKMKKEEVDVNENNTLVKNNLKLLMSNYYTKNSFFSSSYFFKDILSSIVKEAEISDYNNYDDVSLTQSLYFNYLNLKEEDISSDAVDLICKRFMAKSIQLDKNVSSLSLMNKKSIKDFSFNPKDISKDDYDKNSESEINGYLEDILATSENLLTLKKTVFDYKNIMNLAGTSFYKRVSNIRICHMNENYSDGYGGEFLSVPGIFGLSAMFNINIFPNYSFLFDFSSKGSFKDDSRIFWTIKGKNRIKSYKKYGEINEDTNEREVEEEIFYCDKNVFDITNSKNIKIQLFPRLCLSDIDRRSQSIYEFPSFVLEDNFDNACNTEGYVFSNIIKNIQDMLSMQIKDYRDSTFNNESDINSFIEENENILSDIRSLISFYKDIYLTYFCRVQRLQAMKVFAWQKKIISHGKGGGRPIINENMPYNGIISKHSNVYSSFKDAMDLNYDKNINILTKDQNIEMVKDIQNILDDFVNSQDSFINEVSLESTQSNFVTKMTKKFYNIMSSLYTSDLSQAFTFDIVNGYINHQTKIVEMSSDELSSSEKFNSIDNVSREIIEKIEDNTSNVFFINKLSKILTNIDFNNAKNHEYFNNIYKNSSDFYINNNIFTCTKDKIEEEILNTCSRIDNSNNVSKELFFNLKEDYINSNFYSFGLKNEYLEKFTPDSLIKITVNIVDKFNLSRYYLPKVYIFSPLLTSLDFLTSSDLKRIGLNFNVKDIIGVYDINKSIKERLKLLSFRQESNNSNSFIADILRSKFNSQSGHNFSEEDYAFLLKYLFNCHLSSFESDKIIKNIYSLNSLNDYNDETIDRLSYNMIENLSEKSFFDIFDNNKEKVMDEIVIDGDNILLPESEASIRNNTHAYNMLSNIDNIISFNSSIDMNFNYKYYDIYNIAINPSYFCYINTTTNNQANNDEIHTQNKIQKVLNKLSGASISFIENKSIYKTTKSIDNFSVVFKVEVI